MKQQPVSHVNNIAFFGIFYLITFAIIYMTVKFNNEPDRSFDGIRLLVFCLLVPVVLKFAFQLIIAPLYPWVEFLRWRRRDLNDVAASNPLISVLVPAWNEEVGILKTIRSVLQSTYKNFELIVVNDGSTDGTHRLMTSFLEEYESESPLNRSIRYLQLENGGKAKALNAALMQAKGDIIFTIDADSVMDTHALENIITRFTSPAVGAVAGNVIVANRQKPIGLIQQLEYVYGFFFKRSDSLFNSVYIVGGAAAAYRRDTLLEMGGFDENIITEDIEMSVRIISRGYKTRYAADAIIYTEGPSDWAGLCNQRLRWRYGRLLTLLKHRDLFFSLRKGHSPYLTFMVLPFAIYADLLLLLEGPILGFLYGYTFLTLDFLPLTMMMFFIASLVTLQVSLDHRSHYHRNLLWLAPIAWVVLYIVDCIEFQALCRSLKRLVTRERLEWQKWVRVGILAPTLPPTKLPRVLDIKDSSP